MVTGSATQSPVRMAGGLIPECGPRPPPPCGEAAPLLSEPRVEQVFLDGAFPLDFPHQASAHAGLFIWNSLPLQADERTRSLPGLHFPLQEAGAQRTTRA